MKEYVRQLVALSFYLSYLHGTHLQLDPDNLLNASPKVPCAQDGFE